jgi:hypothetical protein
MRVAWNESDKTWLARIGPCYVSLRQMDWHDTQAREHRDAIDRTWIYSVRHFPEGTYESSMLAEGIFEVARSYSSGLYEAQHRAVNIARELALCKRTHRKREVLDPEAIAWLEERLLETLRESYTRWRATVADVKQRAAAGEALARETLWIGLNKIYPEPKWWTARLALDAAQYSRPDDLNVSDKRFYVLVRNTLERLKRRGLITASTGLDTDGHETTLWEPV